MILRVAICYVYVHTRLPGQSGCVGGFITPCENEYGPGALGDLHTGSEKEGVTGDLWPWFHFALQLCTQMISREGILFQDINPRGAPKGIENKMIILGVLRLTSIPVEKFT